MARAVLAIDAGTTGVRAVVYDERATPVATAYRELAMSYPRPGWVEQDASLLWKRTREAIAAALEAADLAPVDTGAIGITNQRASVVAWDANTLEPLCPMIVWQDVRTAERCRELGEQGLFITVNMAASKLEWIVKHVDRAREAAARGTLRVGTPDSFLCARLSNGAHATDHSNASTTGFYAHFERRWDANTLAALDIDAGILPAIVETAGVVAETDSEAFGARVPLAALCGDQQAALYGLGCLEPGATKCTYGTAAMVDANSGDQIAIGAPGTYPLVAWSIDGKTTFCVEGNVITAGAAVQWLRDTLGLIADAGEITALAGAVEDSGGVWVVPAFQGLGTPFAATAARATIGGLSRASTRAHIARAVLEGIAQRVVDAAEAVWQAGAKPAVLRVDGGASANDVLLQMQADLLGMPVERSAARDGAALGAALLAARATKIWPDDAIAWRPDAVFEPKIDDCEREARRAAWRRRIELVVAEAGAQR